MNHNTEDLFCYTNPTPDTSSREGRLNNLRVAVRPNISVCKWPAQAGSKALENYHPAEDATVVERLKEQGAQFTGMSKMSELGFGIASDTTHLIVSENQSDLVLGTDVVGEIRHLSIMAGAWGYKPSFGICSNLGIINLVPSMECVAVIAKKPAQISDVLSTISGKDDRDLSMVWENLPDFTPQSGKADFPVYKIGFLSEQINGLNKNERSAFNIALSELAGKGIQVEEISFPDYALFKKIHQVIGATEASSSAGKYDGVRYGHRNENAANWNEMYLSSRQEAFGPLIKSYLFQGAWFQFKNYEAFEHACRLRNRLIKKTGDVFGKIDFLASPVRCREMDASRAESIPATYDAFALTLIANVTGSPSLCVPGIVKSGEMDLGLQLTAPHLSDVKLLDFALGYLA